MNESRGNKPKYSKELALASSFSFIKDCLSAYADKGTPDVGSLRPNGVWPTLLRFQNHRVFRTLRSATKGFALGTHKPFEKGLTENFHLLKSRQR